jgi:hypothetical protein
MLVTELMKWLPRGVITGAVRKYAHYFLRVDSWHAFWGVSEKAHPRRLKNTDLFSN